MNNIEIIEMVLQVVSSLGLLISKFFLASKKSARKLTGWKIAFIGTSTWMMYIYCLMTYELKGNMWVLITYGFATLILYIYAFFTYSAQKYINLLKNWDLPIKIFITFLTTITCMYILVEAKDRDNMGAQIVSVISGLIGTLTLAIDTRVSKIIGWLSYLVSHIATIYIMTLMCSYFFVTAQVISAAVAVLTIVSLVRKK